jgi:hypothetical protein
MCEPAAGEKDLNWAFPLKKCVPIKYQNWETAEGDAVSQF